MKKEIAKKWVRALRSKKYRQAKGLLKTKTKSGPASHCCLGVLCELYQQERKKNKKSLLDTDDHSARESGLDLPKTNRVFEFNGESTALPDVVRAWAGIADDAGCFRGDFLLERGDKLYNSLAEMNDSGCRFSTIADVIEKYPEKI